jgi:hypothetical protein
MKAAIQHLIVAITLAVTFITCTQKDITNVTNSGFTQPEISIILPAPGDTLRGVVAISVQASGSAEISYVEFYLDGVLLNSQAYDSTAPYEYLWNSVSGTDGNHLIFARAWTPRGNYGDAVPLLVKVDNVNDNVPRTLRVPSQYPAIQQGVNAAKDGDTVLVEPGVYHEDFNFRGKGIWVKSEMGPAQTIWEGVNQNIFIYFNSGEDTMSVLCGFKIQGAYNGILIDLNSSPTIINCIIKDIEWTGIIGGPTNAKIINNTIFNCYGQYGTGLQVGGICSVINNVVVHGISYGCWNTSVNNQYSPIADFNDIWDWGIANYNDRWNIGAHDLSLDPMFQDTVDFRLQPGSPCINAGDPLLLDPDGTRSDMGAWGGPHAY